MKNILDGIKLINCAGYIILNSKDFFQELFTKESRFRNGKEIEPELPKELSFPLGPGIISYIEFFEYTEYDDFLRKIERHDFMSHKLEKLIEQARTQNIVSDEIPTVSTQFYQGYENGEFPGKREIKKYHKGSSLNLSLSKGDEGLELYLEPVISQNKTQ